MKKVLITGIAGFVGRNLADFIRENVGDFDVYGADILCPKFKDKRYVKGDLQDKNFLKNVINKIRPDYLFHLAGSTGKHDFCSSISSNVFTTHALLDYLLEKRCFNTRVVIPGSAAEYGCVRENDLPVKESQPLSPVNSYGLSKMYQTLLALGYHRKGLDVVVGRVFNISGEGMPRSFSIGKFAYELSLIEKGRKRSVIETGSLESRRDYLDIKDVCSALIAIAQEGKRGNIYNICSGRSYKTKEILQFFIKTMGLKGVKIKPSVSGSIEVKNINGSNDKIKAHAKWKPKIDFFDSLRRTLDYYRRKR